MTGGKEICGKREMSKAAKVEQDQNVCDIKWRQSLWNNSDYISWPSSNLADHTNLSMEAVITPSQQVSG